MKKPRTIIFYKDYFLNFYPKLPVKLQEKYDYVFVIIRQAEHIPVKFFKHITDEDNLYEIRVEYKGNLFRTFCCFDKGNVIVLFNMFMKKSQKTSGENWLKPIK